MDQILFIIFVRFLIGWRILRIFVMSALHRNVTVSLLTAQSTVITKQVGVGRGLKTGSKNNFSVLCSYGQNNCLRFLATLLHWYTVL